MSLVRIIRCFDSLYACWIACRLSGSGHVQAHAFSCLALDCVARMLTSILFRLQLKAITDDGLHDLLVNAEKNSREVEIPPLMVPSLAQPMPSHPLGGEIPVPAS